MSPEWDPKAHAEEMKRSTFPVSAFFFLDSLLAVHRCIAELEHFRPHGLPSMKGSAYFSEIEEVVRTDRVVHNFDFDFEWRCHGTKFPGVVRCHSVGPGQYEIELWVPGVIANELKGTFSDGIRSFFCAFMPPSLYD